MEKVFQALDKLRNSSGANDKAKIIKANAEVPGFKEVLQFVYNPYIRTCIARAKLSKATVIPDKEISIAEMIEYFTANTTGTGADASFARTFVEQFDDAEYKDIAAGIVTKTLKTGVTAKSLNKIFGAAFIPLIGIMRGESYDDFKGKVKGPFIATEKIDGIRRLLVKKNGEVTMYSRSGIPDDGLVDIIKEAEHLPDNCVYDGELAAKGQFENALELRQATASIANRKGNRTGVDYLVFDMIPLEDYMKGKSTHEAAIRKIMLGALFGDVSIECIAPNTYKQLIEKHKINHDFKHIRSIPIEGIASTEDEVLMLAQPIWRRGYEGIMLVKTNSFYDYTKEKSRDLLKVKHSEEYVLTVIGVEEGKAGTKNEGKLGALIVDYEGAQVGVGSGLDDSQRNLWWANPDLIIGKQIEIETFGKSTNAAGGHSLNCPIFKRVVGAE